MLVSQYKHVLRDDFILFVMDIADVNGDGVLSYTEFQSLVGI